MIRIDDVEDGSQLRRGIPGRPSRSPLSSQLFVTQLRSCPPAAVAHKIYGVPQTINSANYVYFLAYQELFKLRELDRQSGGIPPKVELDRMVTGT